MPLNLRTEQSDMVADAVDFFRTAQPGDKRLYVSPTGSGKSYMILGTLAEANKIAETIAVVPPGVVDGMLTKLGFDTRGLSGDDLATIGQGRGLWSPMRLLNKLRDGRIRLPRWVVYDEGHHSVADSWRELQAMMGYPPRIGLTATAFRGTPRSTAELMEHWGHSITQVDTLRGCSAKGYISFPVCSILPLVDDDVIEISAGEFKVSSAGKAVASRVHALAEHCADRYCIEFALWDRPTMFALPSVDACWAMHEALLSEGMGAAVVLDDTPDVKRRAIYERVLAREVALVQINVVSEGVDLPLRRLIDAAPQLSPLAWMQRFGRIMRPVGAGEAPPEYVCTNRNLERHAYLTEGLIPTSKVKEAVEAFGAISKRVQQRVIGLEDLGRFKGVELPLADGTRGIMYCLNALDPTQGVWQYAALCHPCSATPIYARRLNRPDEFGKWERIYELPNLKGWATSVPAGACTSKQIAKWQQCAKYVGLDPTYKPNRKVIQALFVLLNTGRRIQP